MPEQAEQAYRQPAGEGVSGWPKTNALPSAEAKSTQVFSGDYRADIDGLRAIAVMPVVLFHAGVTAMSGGYVGVDVFFVISGFLITGIMRKEIIEGRFSILNFYERRTRRILPALSFAVALTLVAAVCLLLPTYLVDFGRSLIFLPLFLSNFYFYKHSGYFENSAALRPLLQTWSLAVEEQFYIFMPLAVWAVHAFLNKRWRLVFGSFAAMSFALSVYMMSRGPTANFFLLPTRAWELLLGSLLVMAPPAPLRNQVLKGLLASAGLALIAWPVFAFSDATPFPGLNAAPPCFGALILIYTGVSAKSFVNRVLSWTPLVLIGQISYSLYLLHWPVTVFFRYLTLRKPDAMGVAFIVALSLALALFSWRFVERPFRNRAFLPARWQLFGLAGFALVAMAVCGVGLVATRGLPQRFPNAGFVGPHVAQLDPSEGRGWRNGQCFFLDVAHAPKWNKTKCALTPPTSNKALLWGDSFAAHYTPGIAEYAKAIPYQVYQYTMAGCPPVLTYYSYARPGCQAFNKQALTIIKENGIKTVVLSARWVDLKSRGMAQLKSTLNAMDALGVQTYVIGQSPDFIANADIIAFLKGDNRPRPIDRWQDAVNPDINRQLRAIAGQTHHFVDPLTSLCQADECAYRVHGELLYYDSGHLTRFGSGYAVRLYFPLYRKP